MGAVLETFHNTLQRWRGQGSREFSHASRIGHRFSVGFVAQRDPSARKSSSIPRGVDGEIQFLFRFVIWHPREWIQHEIEVIMYITLTGNIPGRIPVHFRGRRIHQVRAGPPFPLRFPKVHVQTPKRW